MLGTERLRPRPTNPFVGRIDNVIVSYCCRCHMATLSLLYSKQVVCGYLKKVCGCLKKVCHIANSRPTAANSY